MIAVALKGLLGRKVRALLTALAVVIGVTMVSGTLVLTDTIQKGFDGVFTASYEQTDAVIAGKEIVEGSQSGPATVPESLLAQVRALPEVEAAGGTISPVASNKAEIFGRDGKPVGSDGAPRFGLGTDASQPQFSPFKLTAGTWPEGPGQVAIDAGTAAAESFEVGDTVAVSTLGAKRRYELTGIATFGTVDSLGSATMAIWDLPTAQTLLDKQGRFDGISVAAEEGVSPDELIGAVRPLVPASLEVKDAEQQAAADAEETNVIVNAIRYFLLGFGAIALFVGAFVIFNTLSITVAQRTREFATLRTLGAARKQVMRSVVVEGLVIGLLASVIGLFAGFGLAKLLTALGGELPEAGMVFALRTVLVSLALGTVITLLASVVPALRATRVPPIAAVREGSTLPPSRFAAHSLKLAVGVIAASVAAISVGIFAGGLGTLAVVLLLVGGIVALFVGVALAAPHMVKPLTGLVGLPARRSGGVAGELASANSVRNPGRTASTAAALMIGLTLVTVVAVLGAGMRTTVESAVSDQVDAPYIVDGTDGAPFEAAEGDALARVPGVDTASHVRIDKALVAGDEQDVTGVDPATIARFYTFAWTEGSDAAVRRLDDGGALVTQTYADDHNVAVGERLDIQTASGDKRTVVVRGIYDPPEIEQMLGSITIGRQAFDDVFPQPKNKFTFLDAPADAHQALTAAAADFSDAAVHTGAAFAKDYTEGFSGFLNFLYVLLAFSVVVSLFGMVNTLVLSVFERTRELGMLRTIGMTRRQARRMIRHESIITALIGAALGLPLGIFLALLVTQALSQYDIAVSIPLPELVAFTLVAILAGLGAAIVPARRASRLNVLDALHYE
ncbi:MAG TPA: FtsX-like permease family protein [Solirubrobacteraceae bacterium]|nr:FtsX-like permease family protein [Solirubrobacteraceae bacterium]